jgi:hypothetical protein
MARARRCNAFPKAFTVIAANKWKWRSVYMSGKKRDAVETIGNIVRKDRRYRTEVRTPKAHKAAARLITESRTSSKLTRNTTNFEKLTILKSDRRSIE